MKVIVLTRGDLAGMLRLLFFVISNPCSDVCLNGQESAEAIVPRRKKELREGLNVKRSLTYAGLVSNAVKAANPDTRGNYQREVGVELRGNAGEPSVASASA